MDFAQPIDLHRNELKGLRIGNVSALSTGLTTAHMGAVETYNGIPYHWSGSAWVAMTGGAGGTSNPMPQRCLFVSPSFTQNSGIYYNDIATAMSNVQTQQADLIYVFAGEYLLTSTLTTSCDIYCEAGVIIKNNSTSNDYMIVIDGGHSVLGHGRFFNNSSSPWTGININETAEGTTFQADSFDCNNGYTVGNGLLISCNNSCYVDCNRLPYVYNNTYTEILNSILYIRCVELYGYADGGDDPKKPNIYYRNAVITAQTINPNGRITVLYSQLILSFQEFECDDNDAHFIVSYRGNLTLRHGVIKADSTATYIHAVCLINDTDETKWSETPILRLEQVTIRGKYCVQLNTVAPNPLKLITKNCTFVATTNSIIGNDTNACIVKNEGGGSCANLGTTGVTQQIQNILVATNVEI